MVSVETMERYVGPINPAVYPHLSCTLLGIGIFFMAWFFVYEVTSNKYTRNLLKVFIVERQSARSSYIFFWTAGIVDGRCSCSVHGIRGCNASAMGRNLPLERKVGW